MHIDYEPHLIQQVVVLSTRGDSAMKRRLHAMIDDLKDSAKGEECESQLRNVYSKCFLFLNLDRIVRRLVSEWPLIADCEGTCRVREASGKTAESVELILMDSGSSGKASDPTLEMQICPRSLLDPSEFSPWMRRELAHVSDMLDPEFQYSAQATEKLPSRRKSLINRYQVLWDIYVEARLIRDGVAGSSLTSKLRLRFEKLFTAVNPSQMDRMFERVLGAKIITHPQILGWARSPGSLDSSLR
jgi:hypothetical protein